MKLQILPLAAFMLTASISSSRSLAQRPFRTPPPQPISFSYPPPTAAESFSSSRESTVDAVDPGGAFVALAPSGIVRPRTIHPFSTVGLDWHTGIGGAGFDVATPLSETINLRAGADFFSYATSLQEQGANVTADLRLRSGHASLDWFPLGGRFRLSPLVVFANSSRIQATATVPSGSTVTMNGQDYISSSTDPLHGSGLIDFPKVSPGFSLGFGNIVPRTNNHFSMPIEAGFYYVGQPHLTVGFSGSACDPSQPAAVGCQPVAQDLGFQHDLAAFVARNNNNLSYASFLPIFSVGFAYKF